MALRCVALLLRFEWEDVAFDDLKSSDFVGSGPAFSLVRRIMRSCLRSFQYP